MEIFKEKLTWLILAILALIIIFFSVAVLWSGYILFALLFILLLTIFIIKPELGIYAIAFLYPFTYFEFIYRDIDVPYVDFVALILFVAWCLKSIYLYLEKGQKLSWKNFPALIFMSLFVLAAFLSLLNVDRENFYIALKYVFRPIIFFYLMYVILPFNIINNLKKLFTTFKIMFVLGIGLSIMGIWSIILTPSIQLKRATPTAIFSIYPMGTNHNSLAEVLVCLIPIALILFWYERDVFKNIFTSYLPYLSLILLAPIIYLMYKLFSLGVVARSDVNRLDLIELAFTLFKNHPLFGNGVATFTIVLSQAKWYIIEYGTILDAHGFIFKTIAETGLFGTLSFISLLSYILYILLKTYLANKKAPNALLILGGFLAVAGGIAFQLFNTSYFVAKLWLPIGLALTILKLTDSYFFRKNKIHDK
ncbi:MAG: hypothetical protein NTX00_02195 [Candidatus Parcubacteria bacterium]|nr:hypothetical protein [Candidatus Parcubacteria bacterium]